MRVRCVTKGAGGLGGFFVAALARGGIVNDCTLIGFWRFVIGL